MNEADIKRCIADYLEIGTNQGHWYSDRLNSGDTIEIRGGTRRRIQLCRAGTSDFFVLVNGMVIFLEVKTEKGKESPEQRAFEILVTAQGARYEIVRSVDDVQRLLK